MSLNIIVLHVAPRPVYGVVGTVCMCEHIVMTCLIVTCLGHMITCLV